VNVQRRNIRIMLTAFVVMFAGLTVYLGYSVLMYGDRWFANAHNPRIAAQKSQVVAGDIRDRNGVTLATNDSNGERTYAADMTTRKAVSTVVGDNYGVTTAGAETFFANYLLGFNDNVIERLYQEITGGKREGSDVVLTVDSELSRYAYNAMGNYRGAVVMMDYRTGEIIASVSKPGFDPNNIEDYMGVEGGGESPLVNRVTMGRYTPGSVFKIVTAAAALENDPEALTKTYTCDGRLELGDTAVTDANNERHGNLKLHKAFVVSCNNTFAQVGMNLGAAKLNAMAEKFGLNKNFLFNDMVLYSSSFTMGTPLHMCMIAGTVANGGVMMEPKLVKEMLNARGYPFNELTPNEYGRPISEKTAETLRDMMIDVVKSGTGTRAKVSGWSIAGKTGTAQVSESDEIEPNAWFVGFVNDEDHPLSIAVVLEDAGSGGSKAAPVAAKVLAKAKALGY